MFCRAERGRYVNGHIVLDGEWLSIRTCIRCVERYIKKGGRDISKSKICTKMNELTPESFKQTHLRPCLPPPTQFVRWKTYNVFEDTLCARVQMLNAFMNQWLFFLLPNRLVNKKWLFLPPPSPPSNRQPNPTRTHNTNGDGKNYHRNRSSPIPFSWGRHLPQHRINQQDLRSRRCLPSIQHSRRLICAFHPEGVDIGVVLGNLEACA